MKLMQTIHGYDVTLFSWVMRRKTQKLQVRCARWVSRSGDGYLYLTLALLLAWAGRPDDYALLACLVLGFALERPLYFVIKNGFKRDRPPAALNIKSFVTPSDRFSFPSGHTSAAFLVATLLGYFHPVLLPPLLVWAGLIGMARVVLGVHFPTDTLIGALMGAAVAMLSLEILIA
ncbi:phosphatase PAP2 family protein [Methylococcus sp. EFPC2]|uniref:phosphatase PAP2 family protein n=1 Tax=Methylococcus sp. EFPC2 TaxID=2812648 RepID=UPI001967E590|nr:phosphatase PAP2 family protein [Methylococcus sp. EFPC2]QSA96861.1 phosphatase PAP2 family protein [Methylococcus sp. EFPC2]